MTRRDLQSRAHRRRSVVSSTGATAPRLAATDAFTDAKPAAPKLTAPTPTRPPLPRAPEFLAGCSPVCSSSVRPRQIDEPASVLRSPVSFSSIVSDSSSIHPPSYPNPLVVTSVPLLSSADASKNESFPLPFDDIFPPVCTPPTRPNTDPRCNSPRTHSPLPYVSSTLSASAWAYFL